MKLLLPFATLVALLTPALAQDAPAPTPQPAWIDPGFQVDVLRQKISFDVRGVEAREVTFEATALNERGARAMALQRFAYNSYFDDLALTGMETVKQDGRVVPVDARAIQDQPSGTDPSSPYIDEQRIKLVAYSDVQPRDKIRGTLIFRGKRPQFEGHVATLWNMEASGPRGSAEVTVSLPASMAAKARATGFELQTSSSDGRTEYRGAFRNDSPSFVPLDDRAIARMPRLEISTFTDYPALAGWMGALNEPMAAIDNTIRSTSEGIVGDAADDRTKASRIHNWVARNIRYVGIGLEDGGFRSQPAAAVLAARYGDCKAHATLLKALLAVQGIEANFVVVNTTSDFSLPELPVPRFDHAIVYLPAFDIYLDPTAPSVPFGALPPALYGKPALNLDRKAMVAIPRMRAHDNVWETRSDVVLDASGARHGTATFSGNAPSLRSIGMQFETIDRKLWVERDLRRYKEEGRGDVEFPNPRDLDLPFQVKTRFEITRAVDLAQPSRVRAVPVINLFPTIHAIAVQGPQDQPFRCFPLDYRQTTSTTLPTNVLLTARPPDFVMTRRVSGKTAYGEVSGMITVSSVGKFEQGAFLLERRARFEFDAPICPASFRADLDAALAKWDAVDGLRIGLSPNTIGSTTSDGSDLDAGLKAFSSGNFERALSLLGPLAEKGDVEAQIRMALIFRDGKGVKPDPETAFRWSTKAAEAGNANGREMLGWAYEMGRGTVRDLAMAAKFYEMAAVGGRAYAQGRLGVFYRYGSGVPRDYARSLEWLQKAVDGGYAPALVDLGSMYEDGLGTPKDLDQAAVLYGEAAQRGDKRGSERFSAIKGTSR